jgi:drug/metabolite transporter (DMT)-like permease
LITAARSGLPRSAYATVFLSWAMYAALKYGPVTVISPLIAGYPLVTLLLSRAFLGKEDVGPQLMAGVTGVVCGVVLLLVA